MNIDTLFIVNQKSGTHNSLNLLNKLNNNIKEKGLILISNQKKDTDNLLKCIDTKNLKKIIGVGGDGTINQILESSIDHNKDIVFGHIPTGTGNGLAASILYNNNLDYNIENSMVPFLNNSIKNIDIAEIKTKDKILHSFLAISIGFISDLDIQTEFLRFLGSFRYYLGSIYGLYQMKKYNIELSYLNFTNDQWENLSDDFIMLWASNVSHPSYDVFLSNDIKFDDGYHHLFLIKNSISRLDLLYILLNLDSGNICDNPNVIYIKTNHYKIKVNSDDNGILTVDGEKIDYQDIEVKVNNKSAKIFA